MCSEINKAGYTFLNNLLCLSLSLKSQMVIRRVNRSVKFGSGFTSRRVWMPLEFWADYWIGQQMKYGLWDWRMYHRSDCDTMAVHWFWSEDAAYSCSYIDITQSQPMCVKFFYYITEPLVWYRLGGLCFVIKIFRLVTTYVILQHVTNTLPTRNVHFLHSCSFWVDNDTFKVYCKICRSKKLLSSLI